jgi:hypothetical protein
MANGFMVLKMVHGNMGYCFFCFKSGQQKISRALPSLRSGRATFPPFLLGGLLPSGLGLRPRAASALCRFAAGPGGIALQRDL